MMKAFVITLKPVSEGISGKVQKQVDAATYADAKKQAEAIVKGMNDKTVRTRWGKHVPSVQWVIDEIHVYVEGEENVR